MSWVSNFWRRNKGAIQSIAKPLISKIPVVGGVVASRINMSPTPNQAALSAQTAITAAALQPAIAAVNNDARAVAEGRATPKMLGLAPMYWVAGIVVILVLFLILRKRH